jgi:murein DD-endopeptidase MepM/ murein hydrolase activator NlpD
LHHYIIFRDPEVPMSRKTPKQSIPLEPVFLLLIALALGVVAAFMALTAKIHSLERQLEKERRAAEASIAERDSINRKLERELDLLKDQAYLAQLRMAELERLEREMRRMANRAQIAVSASGVPSAGAGGLYVAYEARKTDGDAEAIRDKFAELLEDARVLRNNYLVTLTEFNGLHERLRQTPIMWPTDSRKINSPYGYRRDPFSGQAAHHNGIDIDGEKGDPVYAAADGVVQEAGWKEAHGRQIVIMHNERYTTVYSHLNALHVEPGQIVRQGDPIGEIGSSGRSTGPHLHYEILLDGVHVDPEDYLLISREEADEPPERPSG